jgi:hypothetical protein
MISEYASVEVDETEMNVDRLRSLHARIIALLSKGSPKTVGQIRSMCAMSGNDANTVLIDMQESGVVSGSGRGADRLYELIAKVDP